MKNQKIIIIAIIGLITASLLFLGVVEYRQRTGEISQGWWSTYFVAPYNANSLDFIIENHSEDTQFKYDVLIEDEIKESKKVLIQNGTQKLITPEIKKDPKESAKIKIESKSDKKSLYKN